MEWTSLLTVHGPLSLGWVVAGFLLKWILARYDTDVDAKIKLALALQELANQVKEAQK